MKEKLSIKFLDYGGDPDSPEKKIKTYFNQNLKKFANIVQKKIMFQTY